MLKQLMIAMVILLCECKIELKAGDKCTEKDGCYCSNTPKEYKATENKCLKFNWNTCEKFGPYTYVGHYKNNCWPGQYCYTSGSVPSKECAYKVIGKEEVCREPRCACGDLKKGKVGTFCDLGKMCNEIKGEWLCATDFVALGQRCPHQEGCVCYDTPLAQKKFISEQINLNEICAKSDGELGGYQKKIKPDENCDQLSCLCEATEGGVTYSKFMRRNEICKFTDKKIYSVKDEIELWKSCLGASCFCRGLDAGVNLVCSYNEYCAVKDGKGVCIPQKISVGESCDVFKGTAECICEWKSVEGKIERVFVKYQAVCVRVDNSIQSVSSILAEGFSCEKDTCACTNGENKDIKSATSVTVVCKKTEMCATDNKLPVCLKADPTNDVVCDNDTCSCVYNKNTKTCKKGQTCKGGAEHGCYKKIIEHEATCDEPDGCLCYDNPKDAQGNTKERHNSAKGCLNGFLCISNSARLTMECINPKSVLGIWETSKSDQFGCKVTDPKTQKDDYIACKPLEICTSYEGKARCALGNFSHKEICLGGYEKDGSEGILCICGDAKKPEEAAICDFEEQCSFPDNKKPECKKKTIYLNDTCTQEAGCNCIAENLRELKKNKKADYESVLCKTGEICLSAPNGYHCASVMLPDQFYTSDNPAGFACVMQTPEKNKPEYISCYQHQTCRYNKIIGFFCEESSLPFIIKDGERCSNIRSGCQCTKDEKTFNFCKGAEVCRTSSGLSCKTEELNHYFCPAYHSCLCGPAAVRSITDDQWCEIGRWNAYTKKDPEIPEKLYKGEMIQKAILERMKKGIHKLYTAKRNLGQSSDAGAHENDLGHLDVLVKI